MDKSMDYSSFYDKVNILIPSIALFNKLELFYHHKLPMLKLYRDDVEYVLKTLNENGFDVYTEVTGEHPVGLTKRGQKDGYIENVVNYDIVIIEGAENTATLHPLRTDYHRLKAKEHVFAEREGIYMVTSPLFAPVKTAEEIYQIYERGNDRFNGIHLLATNNGKKWIHIILDAGQARVGASDETDTYIKGICSKIIERLEKRERKLVNFCFSILFSYYTIIATITAVILAIASALLLGLNAFGFIHVSTTVWELLVVGYIIAILIELYPAIAHFIIGKITKYTIIYNKSHSDLKWYESDVMGILTIVGFILTILGILISLRNG